MRSRTTRRTLTGAILLIGLVAGLNPAQAGPPPDYDFDWVTIGDPGNAPYPGGGPNNFNAGRGGVDYRYRMSRTEIRASQWLEFVNTFAGELGDPFQFFNVSSLITRDFSYTGPGRQYKLAEGFGDNPGDAPVLRITWRNAARYANWLHNDKAPTLDALATGAYDTSTWGNDGIVILDDEAHLPGARFWIPTLDEWLKAVHYDPDKNGPGQGGWWEYPDGSDTPLIPGPPGLGQTTAGIDEDELTPALFRIGIYPDVQTPWGLLDASGAGSEWLEDFGNDDFPASRMFDGAPLGDPDLTDIDTAWLTPAGSFTPISLRLASAVPSPPSAALLVAWLCFLRTNTRRAGDETC